jgi:hypothetical protein
MGFLDENIQTNAPDSYTLSNAANVTDLLDEMDQPVEQFEQNSSSLNDIIDSPQNAADESKEAELTSTFLVFAIDKLVDQSCKMISKDRDHDFSMTPSERKDLENQAKAMLKGNAMLPRDPSQLVGHRRPQGHRGVDGPGACMDAFPDDVMNIGHQISNFHSEPPDEHL